MADPVRRLAAILVADVYGYTRMMERDEESARRLINLHRDVFKNHAAGNGGTVVDTSGDSILAEFPSVQRAVECAVAFQLAVNRFNTSLPAVERMEFRIGLNIGDVLDDQSGIYGDAVNTAARLQQLAAPGGICVSGTVRELVEGRVGCGFQFLREQRVRNRKRPVRVFRVLLEQAAAIGAASRPMKLLLSTEPSIAVLPFRNLGGNPDEQYLGDGLAEDIIIELSRFRSINVVARTTSFAYRDEDDCLAKLRDELNVQYALEGSIRRVGPRVRINAQLVECESGKQLWGDHYTHDAEAIFEVQDEVVGMIVGMLENRLLRDRLSSTIKASPNTHRAYDFWLRGNRLLEQENADSLEQASALFRRALELDPAFSRAYTSLAAVHYQRVALSPGSRSWRDEIHCAIQHGRTALRLDPADGRAHAALGRGLLLARDYQQGRSHFETALDLNPNDADILIQGARAMAFLGDAEGGLELAKRSMRLNPVHPRHYVEFVAIIQFLGQHYEDCAHSVTVVAGEGISPEYSAFLAAAFAYLGDMGRAGEIIDGLVGALSSRWCGDRPPDRGAACGWLDGILPLALETDRLRWLQGLERAGMTLRTLPRGSRESAAAT